MTAQRNYTIPIKNVSLGGKKIVSPIRSMLDSIVLDNIMLGSTLLDSIMLDSIILVGPVFY